MRSILLLLLLLISASLFAQHEPLNQLDAKGKKHGKWTVYLDKNWKTLRDSSGAAYYVYTRYEHEFDIYNMGYGGKKNWRLETPATDALLKKPVLANGEYTWYNNKGERIFVHVFKEGEYQSYKEYYPSGVLKTKCDYTKQLYWNQPNTFALLTYNKKGLETGYFVAPWFIVKEEEKHQHIIYNDPHVDDYYLVYDDKISSHNFLAAYRGSGTYNLAKVVAVTVDSLKLVLSSLTSANSQNFYDDINSGLTESNTNYFKNDSIFTMARITDDKLKWKWIKEVIRK